MSLLGGPCGRRDGPRDQGLALHPVRECISTPYIFLRFAIPFR